MKTKLTPILAILLAALLLSAAACGRADEQPTDTTTETATGADGEVSQADTANGEASETDEGATQAATDLPVYPGDIELNLPEMKEEPKVVLSRRDGKILGFSAMNKPQNSEFIESYTDFQTLYGTAEGIDEAFFETYTLRLVHTAQSASSTHYAIDSVSITNTEIKVEIIEQYAAMSTRDLRYHYIFIAVEKIQTATPTDVHVTSVQLAS